jgi:cysteine desulfurase
MKKLDKKRIYLDYASGAPVIPEVRKIIGGGTDIYANPSSIHKDGVEAKKILEDSRIVVAKALSAHPDEIVFTRSGTESDNLAVLGVFKSARMNPSFSGKDIHIITTSIEHPAILEACRHLEKVGAKITYLSVSKDGIIDLKEFKNALSGETVLVSVAYANNEIGVIQPIREIAKEIRRFKKNNPGSYPYFHTDACQAGAYLNITVEQLGVDLLSLNGTKIGGPRGTGLLYVKRGVNISSIVYGGGQERGLNSGTEDVVSIFGFATALEVSRKISEKESLRLSKLRDYFISELKRKFSNCRVNGNLKERLPNNVSVSFPNIDSELLVLELDARGVSVSAGSACSSAKDSGSHVLEALYGGKDNYGTVRFTFGRETNKSEISYVLKSLSEIFAKYSTWVKS